MSGEYYLDKRRQVERQLEVYERKYRELEGNYNCTGSGKTYSTMHKYENLIGVMRDWLDSEELITAGRLAELRLREIISSAKRLEYVPDDLLRREVDRLVELATETERLL